MADLHYLSAGLRVRSEIALPEWDTFADLGGAERNPDVVIARVSSPKDMPPIPEGTAPVCEFSAPRLGAFRVSRGASIEAALLPGADEGKVRAYVLGTAWSVICQQRGHLVVHGSAVRIGPAGTGGAAMFCAAAGNGKSTLAAHLCSRGHALISDDLCCIRFESGQTPLLYPSAPQFKLWREGIAQLAGTDSGSEGMFRRDPFRADKFHVPWWGERAVDPVPVREVYLLGWGEPGVDQLKGIVALQRFLDAATYRRGLLRRTGAFGRHSARSLEFLREVPVFELRRPRDLTSLAGTVELLEKRWRSSARAGGAPLRF